MEVVAAVFGLFVVTVLAAATVLVVVLAVKGVRTISKQDWNAPNSNRW